MPKTIRVHGSIKDNRVAPELVNERKNKKFDEVEMCNFLNGEAETKARFDFYKIRDEDPVLSHSHEFYDMTVPEKQMALWKKVHHMYKHYKDELFLNFDPTAEPFFHWPFMIQGTLPAGMHFLMGYVAMATLADEEQKAYWLPKLRSWEVIVCYAQTELGHGSNVAGLETTATLDEATDEFVLHSPTITSTKWWPGDMSRFSNYAIVYAQLCVGENKYGVQPFLVQTRKRETFEVMPNIELGDMGPKFGYQSKDNGWLRFDHCRIPRKQMLSGFSKINKDGEFEMLGDLRALYAVMMMVRLHIVKNAGYCLARPVLIAVRYAIVRRQFKTQVGSKTERKIMDYQTHMYKLGPIVARSFLMCQAGRMCSENHARMLKLIKEKDFSTMDMHHHFLSGYKSLFTEWALKGIEDAR